MKVLSSMLQYKNSLEHFEFGQNVQKSDSVLFGLDLAVEHFVSTPWFPFQHTHINGRDYKTTTFH